MHKQILFVLVLFAAGCGASERSRDRVGEGGKVYGGVFNANETEAIQGFFPQTMAQAAAHRVAAQLFEGLVRFDQRDLTLEPALAESWTVDSTGTVYTFRLRNDVRFHDDSCFADGVGRLFVASDVVHCFTALCSYNELNEMFWLFQDRVMGAGPQYAATLKGKAGPGVSGIQALDEHTVRIVLMEPWPSFLQVLAHQGCWIFPKEAVAMYGSGSQWHPVGTGAFRLKSFLEGRSMVLERNPNYWGKDELGNPLPFLDAIRFTFESDKVAELEAFEDGDLSVVYELPLGRTDILQGGSDHQIQSIPGLTVQFYGFNTRLAPLDDPRVRMAIDLAIDRQYLVDSILGGLAVPAEHGVVAPGFETYPYDLIPERRFDPQAARELLAEAGYPNGKGMPPLYLQVNNDGFGYVKVAGAVQSMLEANLGAPVVSTVLPRDQHYERVEMGKAQFWREGWIADHPDPENFLALFCGKNAPLSLDDPSYLNSTRYNNPTFDSLFAMAVRTDPGKERMRIMAEAEAQLMSDAIIAPLYHERSVRILQPWVMDLPINGMEYRDLRAVWFDPTKRK